MRRRSPYRVSASLSLQVSVAAQDLIDFTKTRQDPFHPECSPAENPWIGGSKSGRSSVEQVATAEPHRGHGSFPEWHGPFQGEGCLQGPAGCCGVH